MRSTAIKPLDFIIGDIILNKDKGETIALPQMILMLPLLVSEKALRQ